MPEDANQSEPTPPPQTGNGGNAAFASGSEWLKGEGECSDVVLSSRVRLARNLSGCHFSLKATRRDRQRTLELCRDRILQANLCERIVWVDLHDAPPIERALLVERHLISKQLSRGRSGTSPAADDPRAVAISIPDERLSIMVNEEDHLRIQMIRSGLALSAAWREIDEVDDRIEGGLDYAFHPRLGYLTACPTNVGTGVRMSVMLHLPALRLTGDIEKVKRAAGDMNLAVRGFYGEGSDAAGDFYQISNQTTLGRTESRLLRELEEEIIPKVVEYERKARRDLLERRRIGFEDAVFRAWGMLTQARLLTTEEAMQALSLVRLGVVAGLFTQREGLSIRAVNLLMLVVHPAHLQRCLARELDQEQRRVARAMLVRDRLAMKQ